MLILITKNNLEIVLWLVSLLRRRGFESLIIPSGGIQIYALNIGGLQVRSLNVCKICKLSLDPEA